MLHKREIFGLLPRNAGGAKTSYVLFFLLWYYSTRIDFTYLVPVWYYYSYRFYLFGTDISLTLRVRVLYRSHP
ncbi:hypothetical protein HanRHA438_Chr10g0466631 [Helianthus annuus]|nr:hypothetical protein HanRHA438_Chr10g0466631 [Helianthus annuus]